MNFGDLSKRIWAIDADNSSFYMFRRSFDVGDCNKVIFKISTCSYFALYVNGTFVTRLYHRYFTFAKQYQEFDLSYLINKNAKNNISLLCFGLDDYGFIGELFVDETLLLVTDPAWQTCYCDALITGTPGHSLQFTQEEQYDSRKEVKDWYKLDFDDSNWEKCEEVTNPKYLWKGFNKSCTTDLSYEPICAKAIVSAELAQTREGYRFFMPRQGGVTMFFTEMYCKSDCNIKIFSKKPPAIITVNSIPVKMEESISLPKGRHLLVVTMFVDLEILLATNGIVKFKAISDSQSESDWGMIVLPSVDIKYPWHETVVDIIHNNPQITAIHSKSTLKELLESYKDVTIGAVCGKSSSLFNVLSQEYFLPDNGFLSPLIKSTQSYSPCDYKFVFKNQNNLLHLNNEPCTIDCEEDYDFHFIVDLEREYIGFIDFELEASEGTVLDVQCFELIDRIGVYYMENHNGFSYICKEGYQHFTSNYRRGCRYVSITIRNVKSPVKIYKLSLLYNAYPVEHIGSFECSDSLLNEIYKMSRDTAELCMLDTYVDCPGHEQNYWVGDANITALINLINFGDYKFNQHNIRMVGQSLTRDYVERYFPDDENFKNNRFLSMAAYAAYPPNSSLPMWSYLWVLQCFDHYIYSGNKDDLSENYQYVKQNLENSINLINDRNLLDYPGAWNLIEWAANDLSPYGEVTANNIFLVESFRTAAKMANELSMKEDATLFGEWAVKVYNAVNQYCWNEIKGAFVDTVRDHWSYNRYLEFSKNQELPVLSFGDYLSLSRVSEQTNCLALLYDCVHESRIPRIMPILERAKNRKYIYSAPSARSVGMPREDELVDGIVPVGSPFFLFFTLAALFKTQNDDVALEIIKGDWGDMLKNGTNTCWETFMASEGHYTRSIAHAWSASPAIYLQQNILGIKPLAPGFKEFAVSPCDSSLTWARGSIATPHGPIYISWVKDATGKIDITCDAPDACRLVNPGI